MQIKTIRMPLGYTLETVTESMDVRKAAELLITKRQQRYTSAFRHGFQAELVKHSLLCPHCGHRIPAYARYLQRDYIYATIPPETIMGWASQQLSLFDTTDNLLQLNGVIQSGRIVCPYCKRESENSSKCREVTFTASRRKLEVSAQINDIRDFFGLKWMTGAWLRIAFPIFETVVFHFGRGRTYLKLHDANGTVYTVADITHKPEVWSDGPLYDAFVSNRRFQRTLKSCYTACYGETLPFSAYELTLDRYVLLTRFAGFPRDFYNTVPFTENATRLDEPFLKVAGRLSNAGLFEKAYAESGLPQAKSVRKAFYENPGLLFYTQECRQLWEVLGDINLLRELLTCDAVYEILSQLHLYPGVLAFYRDYCAVKGTRTLLKSLTDELSKLNYEAVVYAVMNAEIKEKERKNWKKDKCFGAREHYEEGMHVALRYLPRTIQYSMPMHKIDGNIRPCEIDGYVFRWLENLKDYWTAGRQLKNCLVNWDRQQNPVVCAFFAGKAVAAIEVNIDRHCIIQARTFENGSIAEQSGLGKALGRWSKRNAMEKPSYDNCEDGEPEL